MKKIIFYFLNILFISIIYGQRNLDRILVRINGDIITEADISRTITQRIFSLNFKMRDAKQEKINEEIKKIRDQALENLINRKMVLFEFQQREYNLPPNAINERINLQIENYAGGSKEEYFRLLEKENLSFEKINKSIKDDIIENIMYSTFVFNKINIGPRAKRRYYDNYTEKFTEVDKVEVQAFIIKRNNYEDDKDFQDRLIHLKKNLKKVKDFTDAVRKNNEHDSAAEDGNYGWLKLQDLNSQFREKIQNLQKGETLYEPVISGDEKNKLAYFFHMKDRIDGKLIPYEKVEGKIGEILRIEKGQPLLKKYLDSLRNKAAIEIFDEKK